MNLVTQRIWTLAAFVAVGFSLVFLLPEAPPIRPSRLSMDLPPRVGPGGIWEGRVVQVSDRERAVLANDTTFERSLYQRPFLPTGPPVEASFVFSGEDMNNSIHRPEVCMRAQGWNFMSERTVVLPDILPDGEEFRVREIISSKTRRHPETNEPVQLADGTLMMDWQILYYTFIGAKTITPSHYGRTFADSRDRVIGGYDQRWAYATFSTLITGKYHEQGVDLGTFDNLDVEQSGEYLADFMRLLLPRMISPAEQAPASSGQAMGPADR